MTLIFFPLPYATQYDAFVSLSILVCRLGQLEFFWHFQIKLNLELEHYCFSQIRVE